MSSLRIADYCHIEELLCYLVPNFIVFFVFCLWDRFWNGYWTTWNILTSEDQQYNRIVIFTGVLIAVTTFRLWKATECGWFSMTTQLRECNQIIWRIFTASQQTRTLNLVIFSFTKAENDRIAYRSTNYRDFFSSPRLIDCVDWLNYSLYGKCWRVCASLPIFLMKAVWLWKLVSWLEWIEPWKWPLNSVHFIGTVLSVNAAGFALLI